MKRTVVDVLVLRGCTSLVPIGIVEMLRKTAELAATVPASAAAARGFSVRLVAPGASVVVETAGGIRITCAVRAAAVRSSALVVVPAIDPELGEKLTLNRAVVPWLRKMFARGADVASACTGAFVLAEAGLLDGRAATTHWAFQPELSRRFPAVRLMPQAVLVDQGRVVTAAAPRRS